MRRRRLAAAAPLGVLLLLPLVAAAGAAAKAPAAPPALPNVTTAMAKGGCKAFSDLIAASPDADSTYQSAVGGGITVFCPTDDAVRAFMPRYKNLTAEGKAELLLFHGVPVYYSRGSLKSNNGVMNTLATDGAAKNYNFTVQNEGDAVTIKTAASQDVARVKSTVLDADPVAIFTVDAVIEPVELFKLAPSPTPAPAPVPAADAPKAATKAAHHPAPVVADAPGPAATDSPLADQKEEAKKSAAAGAPSCVRWFAAALAAVAVVSTLA